MEFRKEDVVLWNLLPRHIKLKKKSPCNWKKTDVDEIGERWETMLKLNMFFLEFQMSGEKNRGDK